MFRKFKLSEFQFLELQELDPQARTLDQHMTQTSPNGRPVWNASHRPQEPLTFRAWFKTATNLFKIGETIGIDSGVSDLVAF